jgi:ATP-dependent Clp protease protease subunit
MDACFALIDIMKGSRIPIHTYGIGCIASCGLLLFLTGKKGNRILTPNTSILSHQYSWGSYGKEHELFAKVKEFNLTTHRMLKHYKKCTGMTEKQIRKYLLPPEDVWLSAEEAKQYGICDEVKIMY